MTDKERIAELEEALARANELLSQQQAMYQRQTDELASQIEESGKQLLSDLDAVTNLVV